MQQMQKVQQNKEMEELKETCARMEAKLDRLERIIQDLKTSVEAAATRKSATTKPTTAAAAAIGIVATWPRPNHTWQEWWRPAAISTADYELLDYMPYHDCLKQTLIKLACAAGSDAPLAALYKNETYSLYIYNDGGGERQWKLADNQDILEMLDLLNMAFHRYYFENVETKIYKDRQHELQMNNLCKINENKYRDDLRLREVRKSLAKKIFHR